MTTTHDTVAITPLERDERVDELQHLLAAALPKERGYAELADDKRRAVDSILRSLATMRFESRDALEQVARGLLGPVAPSLEQYVPIALSEVDRQLQVTKGVLVIYAGGTIGSAPKDPTDPESPQIVRPWRELKNALPQLGLLGYPVDAISFVEPLDSCNVGPIHWRTMASLIKQYYNDYTGFVILHGTDTMVYTASALSFMLLDIAKPIVLTGSQVAGIVNPRNDAHQNAITALMLANPQAHNLPLIPEVVVAFGNIISRGNRAKKLEVVGYQGFRSPNYPSLGTAGEFLTLERKHIKTVPETDPQYFMDLDTNVIILEVFPGMQHSPILGNILRDESLKGVILKSYGAGNIPTDKPFLGLFSEFIGRGGIVVNVTSVTQGEVVMGLYETSQILLDRGIIGGFDITPEAALCKLMMLLGTSGSNMDSVKTAMQKNLAGEQTLSLASTRFPNSGEASVGAAPIELPRQELDSVVEEDRIYKVNLRFLDGRIEPGEGPDRLAITLSLDDGTKLATYKRGRVPERVLVQDESVGESVAFELTGERARFVIKGTQRRDRTFGTSQRVGFSVGVEGGSGGSFSWKSAELNVYFREV